MWKMARNRASLACVCVLCAIATVRAQSGGAPDYSKECKAVINIASITLPSKLILSIASDPNKKSCHFFVSAPPPLSKRRSVDAWYNQVGKAATLNSKLIEEIVTDLAIAPIPADDSQIIQEIKLRINKNSDVLAYCVSRLVERKPVDIAQPDGSFRCTVPGDAEQATIIVAVGQEFSSSVFLPRPA